ncbi:MAG TPA: dockerin type I domain-containing protein [Candidatus Saccharimonadales bacterium]|nr:dockerin type I domain-containing protein [Candidatus Saccharimonadales bacterium]
MKFFHIHRLSKASQLSVLAIVILVGAVFFTVNTALQQQNDASHASGSVIYQSGGYYCYYSGLLLKCISPTPYKASPTPTITPGGTNCIIRPSCYPGHACPDYTVINCPATPAPTSKPSPTPTKAPIIPTATKAPFAPTATKTPVVPTATKAPVATSTPKPTVAPTAVPQPTATPVPGDTTLDLVVGLHGIGTAGDSANPNSDGNMTLVHPDREVTVSVFNSQNQQVAQKQGTIIYNSPTGLFEGRIDLGSQFDSGTYTVKVQTPQFLRGLIPGIQTISSGQVTTLPKVTLIAGDINGDNQVNILDYNVLMGCYSDLLPATDCTPDNNILSDLTDDGAVNQFDYNLFLRELSNVGGN